VPAIEYKGQALRESLVISEFIEEAFPDHKPNVLPADAFERARVRLAIDHISKKIIPAFFRTLQAQDNEGREAGLRDFYDALRAHTKDVKGPFFIGEQFTLADITLAPFIVRDYILEKHRGYKRSGVSAEFEEYAKRLVSRDSVKRTASVSRE
jgi:glutathione S-transferase